MTQQAICEHDWFPTPNQCLAILARYTAPPSKYDKIIAKCQKTAEDHLAELTQSLRSGTATQDQVDAAPERWKRILLEQGYLRFDGDKPQPYIIRERKSDDA